MCLIARHLEANGIPTIALASAMDIVRAGNPPRAVYVDYPLGHTAGRPFDVANQTEIIADALSALETIATPGEIRTLNYRWSDSDSWKTEAGSTEATDTRSPRGDEPVYQTEADRIAAERS